MYAYPHYYDYLHTLDFQANGTVELLDGAGQLINIEAIGKYRVREIDTFLAGVEFYDVMEVHPYQERRKLRDIPAFKVSIKREEGQFPFRQEVVWKIKDENEWPCLLYTARYVFDADPLRFGKGKQITNLYYLLENKDFTESTNCYYSNNDKQELMANKLLSLGIPKEAFW
jgi:hypothetical protein